MGDESLTGKDDLPNVLFRTATAMFLVYTIGPLLGAVTYKGGRAPYRDTLRMTIVNVCYRTDCASWCYQTATEVFTLTCKSGDFCTQRK